MSKRIIIATGGTGGHIYPAIALAQQLSSENFENQVLFVGGGLNENRYFDRNSFAYSSIGCGTFIKKNPKAIFNCLKNIARGIIQSRKIISNFRPDVIVGFGSYYSFPPLVAAKLMSVPIILHEANSIPGKVNRLLSTWATITGVHFPETIHHLKGNTLEVGMPLRQGYKKDDVSKNEAKDYFNLSKSLKTILVFGGSQGSKAINRKVCDAIRQLSLIHQFQVLHIAGDDSMAEELNSEYGRVGIRACVKIFEERMEFAWKVSDLVICRSGAGTIAEQLEFEVPGILIPFPRAADNHQENNADFMTATVGGGVKLNEKELTDEKLVFCLNEFLKNDGCLIQAMQQSMRSYKKKARSKDLCCLVKDFL